MPIQDYQKQSDENAFNLFVIELFLQKKFERMNQLGDDLEEIGGIQHLQKPKAESEF